MNAYVNNLRFRNLHKNFFVLKIGKMSENVSLNVKTITVMCRTRHCAHISHRWPSCVLLAIGNSSSEYVCFANLLIFLWFSIQESSPPFFNSCLVN